MSSRNGGLISIAWAALAVAAIALRTDVARADAPQFVKAAAPVTAKEAFEDSYGQHMVDELH